MALLNATCSYAIRAAVYVASATPGVAGYVSTRKIAEDLGVSFAFLTKVLQGLTQNGILVSQRGSTGGVALARPADSISLLDIVASAGGDDVFRDCVLGLPTCSEEAPCALHQQWRDERTRLEAIFASATLASLPRGAAEVVVDRADASFPSKKNPKPAPHGPHRNPQKRKSP